MDSFLVVDDSVFSQKVTGNYLKKYFGSITVCYAADGEAGLKKYDELKPDCVFVDLLMPKISGLELVKLLVEKKCRHIVVLSADIQKNVRQEAETLGVTAFLNKPLNDEKMQALYDKLKDA